MEKREIWGDFREGESDGFTARGDQGSPFHNDQGDPLDLIIRGSPLQISRIEWTPLPPFGGSAEKKSDPINPK